MSAVASRAETNQYRHAACARQLIDQFQPVAVRQAKIDESGGRPLCLCDVQCGACVLGFQRRIAGARQRGTDEAADMQFSSTTRMDGRRVMMLCPAISISSVGGKTRLIHAPFLPSSRLVAKKAMPRAAAKPDTTVSPKPLPGTSSNASRCGSPASLAGNPRPSSTTLSVTPSPVWAALIAMMLLGALNLAAFLDQVQQHVVQHPCIRSDKGHIGGKADSDIIGSKPRGQRRQNRIDHICKIDRLACAGPGI